ncbi:MAG: Pyruvate synthase subunit PorA [Phycisphaerae bacterium]|nr:Pyruvate synthase subunit PorA [Phycisphaerae bacterium]
MKALVTGNHAAGHVLAACGEANRSARGCAAGAYPITPQTEIIEFLRAFNFSRGRVVPVESEHSAMAVCLGASMNGARAFTASSANGLAYMVENIFAAGYLRLPIVLVAVNRTLGPPWNIWVDQGDSLMFRDAAWIQFYTESHQDLVDTILLAFRVAEDPRVMLPACVAMDGFVVSHTLMGVELPDQAQVDRFLPSCHVPHRLRVERPATIGGLTWPRESEHQRRRIQDAMERVPQVLEEALDEFEAVFGRRPDGALRTDHVDGAVDVLVACNTVARTARRLVEARRERGDPVGLVRLKMFRPFPREALRAALKGVRHVGVLDRNHSPGSGGVFWGEVAATLQGRGDILVQDYIVGLAGGDVTPEVLAKITDDLHEREHSEEPVWQEVGA